MKPLACFLALLFCAFPYTQIIPVETYTQPYATIFSMAFALMMWPVLVKRFPVQDAAALGALALMGTIAFAIAGFPQPQPQEVRYLLIYISPIIFATCGFAAVYAFPRLADRTILFASTAWIVVGLIQATVAPTFATQLVGEFGNVAGDVIDSGRGVLGFAPEPTHFGFHMIAMATLLVLVGGRNVMALACLFTAVFVARSSSALLALVLGSLIYLLVFGGRARLALLLVFPLYYLVGAFVDSGMLPQEWRLTSLMTEFWNDPLYIVTADASTNARLGGIYVAAKEVARNLLFPAGLSIEAWIARTGPIMSENGWLQSISLNGIPSGFLIVIYQLGVFGLIAVVFMLIRLMSKLRSHAETFLICSTVFVFLSQYMISTPAFGLIYGAVIARRIVSGERGRGSQAVLGNFGPAPGRGLPSPAAA